MAKDDYHVIAYQILAYLYQCLKHGTDVDISLLMPTSVYFQTNGAPLNRKYWAYILYHLQKDDLIEGIAFVKADGVSVPYPADIGRCAITPRGIEYLTGNSFMEKAKAFLKDVKEITPFV